MPKTANWLLVDETSRLYIFSKNNAVFSFGKQFNFRCLKRNLLFYFNFSRDSLKILGTYVRQNRPAVMAPISFDGKLV